MRGARKDAMSTTETPRDDFDEFARDYGETLDASLAATGAGRDFFAWNRVDWMRRLEARAGRSPQRILDLGCGDGVTEVHLTEAFPQADISGIDVSAESVKVAAERGLSRCDYGSFDGRCIPFPDDAFDAVFIAGVLHHITDDENRAEIMREVRRVLRPGTPVYIFEQNPWNPVTRRIVDRCAFDRHARLLKPAELRSLMTTAKLTEVTLRFILFAPRHRAFAPIHAVEPWFQHMPIGGQYFGVGVSPDS